MGTVDVEREGQVTVVRLRNASRRNALDAGMWRSFRTAMATVAENPGRAIVLTGDGEHFCSGMDLSPSNPLLGRLVPLVHAADTKGLKALVLELKATVNALAEQIVPIVVAIEGSCLGAGLEFALAGDLRVASSTARFSLPETRWGMVPDVGGTVRLTHLVGQARSAEMVLTGATLDASVAERWGLVNRVVEPGEAFVHAMAMAKRIVQMSPSATKEALQILRLDPTESERLDAETDAGVRALRTGEVLEGFASFAEKREARW